MFIISLVAAGAVIVALTHASILIQSNFTKNRHCKKASSAEAKPAENYEAYNVSSDFPALIDAIIAEGRAQRDEESRKDNAKRFREYITIILIGCALLAIGWQVYEMIEVYGPIRDQAEAAKASAEAASGPIPTLESQALGESAHQIKA